MPCLLYCVTQPKQIVKIAAGVCEGEVQSREMLGVQVYWSEIANPEACLGSAESLKKAALQFHQVLREILATAAPIPFRFPTLLESEDGIEQQLAEGQELYRAALERIGDAVQYEVVASWAAVSYTHLSVVVRWCADKVGDLLARPPGAGSQGRLSSSRYSDFACHPARWPRRRGADHASLPGTEARLSWIVLHSGCLLYTSGWLGNTILRALILEQL